MRSMDQEVLSTISRMTLEEKVSQLFVTYIHGQSADAADPKNQRDFGQDTAAQVVQHYAPGGVIYFHNSERDNIANPRQVAALSNGLQRAAVSSGAKIPLFIGTDQEEGLVTRIGAPATIFPGSMALCAGRSTHDAKRAATITGHELRAMGVNLDFAPDADVNSNPQNPVIGIRSFSSDPTLASEFVTAQVEGYQRSGAPAKTVSCTAKHFPGHGDASQDSHTTLPIIHRTKEEWSRIDAPPFRTASAAGIDVIMTAHIEVPNIDPSGEPSTLSPAIVTGLLRDEIGYDGLVITDSLEMAGVRQLHSDAEIPVLALKAGVDQLLMPPNLGLAVQSVVDAVQAGTLTEERIDHSVRRILRAKYKRGILSEPFVNENGVDDVVGTPEHLAEAARITDRTVTVLRNDGNVLPVSAPYGTVLVTGWGITATNTLATALAAAGAKATAQPTGLSPAAGDIAAVVAAANESDWVVVLTHSLGAYAAQEDLVGQLVATHKPVVAMAVGNPYDAGYADEVGTWLVTYSSTVGSMRSAAKVLLGRVSPVGKLPVEIPAGSDPNTVRFPLGFGLTW
ncbi:MAG TPA: glycoside hydrolase family 3 N-terminal domain-containing protein [Polyangiaceae bacterium]|nr:glycoside hydrolase family 3 N-terminal domain-containing protein [Polyangiaceae bacterium]